MCSRPAEEWTLGHKVIYLCAECAKRIGLSESNRQPRRDGQVRPDPITATGGAASSAPVAIPGAEGASESVGASPEGSP